MEKDQCEISADTLPSRRSKPNSREIRALVFAYNDAHKRYTLAADEMATISRRLRDEFGISPNTSTHDIPDNYKRIVD